MGNEGDCVECGAGNVPVAHFCCQCGRPLDASPGTVGRVSHPSPAVAPPGYRPCDIAADLFFRLSSAWGGSRLLGTENLGISIFNGGYPLKQLVLKVEGLDPVGRPLFEVRHTLADVPRRSELEFEVPSYEITESAASIRVQLVSAEYGR